MPFFGELAQDIHGLLMIFIFMQSLHLDITD